MSNYSISISCRWSSTVKIKEQFFGIAHQVLIAKAVSRVVARALAVAQSILPNVRCFYNNLSRISNHSCNWMFIAISKLGTSWCIEGYKTQNYEKFILWKVVHRITIQICATVLFKRIFHIRERLSRKQSNSKIKHSRVRMWNFDIRLASGLILKLKWSDRCQIQ